MPGNSARRARGRAGTRTRRARDVGPDHEARLEAVKVFTVVIDAREPGPIASLPERFGVTRSGDFCDHRF